MTSNADGWARPELICETDWLAEHIDDDDVLVLDCDLLDAYLRLHIPGAVWSLSRYWKTDPRDDSQIYGMSDPGQWAQLVGRLGITPDTTVVGYDGSGSLYAARDLVDVRPLRAHQLQDPARRAGQVVRRRPTAVSPEPAPESGGVSHAGRAA